MAVSLVPFRSLGSRRSCQTGSAFRPDFPDAEWSALGPRLRARFQELRSIGGLHALSGHDEGLDSGPWHVNTSRFRHAKSAEKPFPHGCEKPATAAGVHYRV